MAEKRILVADDHNLVRETIAAFIERRKGFTILEAGSLDDALKCISLSGPVDLAMLDFEMPGMRGLDGLSRAREANQNKPICIISGVASRVAANLALRNGAAGFLPKSMPARSLINAIEFMLSGEQYVPAMWMIDGVETHETHANLEHLSNRERTVLGGLIRGMTNSQIAFELGLREITAKVHVKNICRKLSARNRTHAALIARECKLVPELEFLGPDKNLSALTRGGSSLLGRFY